MKGKAYTKELCEYLKDYWGIHSPETIAKKFSKVMGEKVTVNQIKNKAWHMGLENIVEAYNLLTLTMIAEVTGINKDLLKRHKIPTKRLYKGSGYTYIGPAEFWKWAYTKRDKLDFINYQKGPLSPEPKWFYEHLKVRKKKYKIWTEAEEAALLTYWGTGKTSGYIAKKLGTEPRVVHDKKKRMKEKRYKLEDRTIKTPQEKIVKCIELRKQGLIYKEIASRLDISIATAHSICKANGYDRTEEKKKTLEEIIRLREQGKSFREIGEILQMSKVTACKMYDREVKKHGNRRSDQTALSETDSQS